MVQESKEDRAMIKTIPLDQWHEATRDHPVTKTLESRTTQKPTPDIILWLTDARGIYIPRDFATSFTDRDRDVTGVSAEDWAILENPDHEHYDDTWSDVLDKAIVTDLDGVRYRLHQDGDLWLVPEGMEWLDDKEVFAWPETEKGNLS
jgi:hypothetical protein